MPWYFYLALKQLFPTGRRFPFFTIVSVAGVALGVWVMIVFPGVMGGFGHQFRGMMIDTQGDIQVRGVQGLSIAENGRELQRRLAKVPGVVATTPFAEGYVMIEHENRTIFPSIQGIDIEQAEKVIPLRKYVTFGSLDALDDDTVILSAGLAGTLGAQVGSKVRVVSPLTLERSRNDEVLLPTELTVAAIFEFGHQQLDGSVVVVTLRRMQDLYGLGSNVVGVNVKLAPGEDVIAAAQRINAEVNRTGVLAKTWMELNDAFLTALSFEKMMVTLITAFVTLVAVFLVASLLIISVVRKTREIGVLGALGGSPVQTAACFCLQGFFIGVLGTAVGVAVGLLTLANVDRILQFVLRLQGNWEAMVQIYQFSQVPAYITAGEIAGVCAYTIALATLAGFVAAWRAARLKPVEAMRND